MSQQFLTPAIQPFQKYFVFRGRAKRNELWIFLFTSLILFQLSSVVFTMTSGPRPEHASATRVWLKTPDIMLDSGSFDARKLYRYRMRKDDDYSANQPPQLLALPAGITMRDFANCGALMAAISAASDLGNGSKIDLYCFENDSREYRLTLLVDNALAKYKTFTGLLGLFLCIPFLALLSRRLHDCNRTSWWLLMLFIPFINGLLLLYCGFVGGEKSDTKFGVYRV